MDYETLDLAYRDRRRTRRAIPDYRALGESRLVSPAEDEALPGFRCYEPAGLVLLGPGSYLAVYLPGADLPFDAPSCTRHVAR